MSNCQIRFEYCQKDVIIQCQRNELMKDIISQYGKKSGLSVDEFYFFYNYKKINLDLTLDQINNKDKEILIIVSTKEIEEKENEVKKSDLIKLENNNEISLEIKIEQSDLNKTIYFLDNTSNTSKQTRFKENDKFANTTLIIDGKTVAFKNSLTSNKICTFSIKLLFKNKLSNCSYMFCGCKNIINIDFSKFNTQNVTDMKYMFYCCCGLKSLNLSSFNTKKVTDMQYMFNGCSSLTTLKLSSFNTENVTNMGSMFQKCSSLTTLNLSSFNTKNVNNMINMFNGCSSLLTLNLSSFNTQNVTTMFDMFGRCSSLTKLNLSSFNTENVVEMGGMFQGCSSLTEINLSSFNTENVTDMDYMFGGCCSLTTLNLSSFNTFLANISFIFYKCINLSSCGSSDKKILEAFKNKC